MQPAKLTPTCSNFQSFAYERTCEQVQPLRSLDTLRGTPPRSPKIEIGTANCDEFCQDFLCFSILDMYLEINANKRSRDGSRKAPVLRAHDWLACCASASCQAEFKAEQVDGRAEGSVSGGLAALRPLASQESASAARGSLGTDFLMIYTTLCPQGGPKARKGCSRTAAEMGNYFPSSRTAPGTGRLRLEDPSSQDAESEKVFEIVSAKFAKAQVQNGADGGRTSRMIVGCFWRSLVSAHGCLGARKPVRNTWQAIGTSDACRT